ncbi:hypothetical protein MKW92_027857 [Papaver armeniacum]|nr:hypothetical protein MKW92_027857 [Papaver armeniacum]
MALLQESSEEVVQINSMSTSKEVEESSNEFSMSTLKEVEESSNEGEEESSESKISISEGLWINSANEALYFNYSPLFVHMASGSLDDEEFYQYVANYSHLLSNFLEVYKLAADQCVDDSDKAAFLLWRDNVRQEQERHNSSVKKLVLNPAKETTLHPATAKYKEFLLAAASGNVQVSDIPIQHSKIPAYTLGAMTPSPRLYAFLSKAVRELVSSYGSSSHPHSKWIKEYSYESFKTSYLHAEVLLDKLCNSLAQGEIEVVGRLYRQAMRLEMDFVYSRHSEQTLIIPIYTNLDPKDRLILFAGFDFTCTDLDSLGILENIAIMTAQKADQQLQGEDGDTLSHITSTDLKNTLELLSQRSTSDS